MEQVGRQPRRFSSHHFTQHDSASVSPPILTPPRRLCRAIHLCHWEEVALPFAPSFAPSYPPSIDPSSTPSFAPSFAPYCAAYFAPSLPPSFAPSLAPSLAPSSAASAGLLQPGWG